MMEALEGAHALLSMSSTAGEPGSEKKKKRSREEKERRKEEKRRKRESALEQEAEGGAENGNVGRRDSVDEDGQGHEKDKKRRKIEQANVGSSPTSISKTASASAPIIKSKKKDDQHSDSGSLPPATQLKTLSQAGVTEPTPTKRKRPSPFTPIRGVKSSTSTTPTPKSRMTAIENVNPFAANKRGRSSNYQEGGKMSDSLLAAQLRTPKAINDWLASNFIKKSEFVRLEKEGIIKMKKGKFTEDEKASMRKALEVYQKVNRMDDDELVNRIMAKTREKGDDVEESRNFWMDVAASVPGRPIPYVQAYLRRAYDPKGHKGKWLPAEDAMLMRAYDLHPNEWSKISDIVERTTHDCRDRWTKELQHRDTRTQGRWTAEEEEQLIECVKKVNRSLGQDELSSNDVAWEIVAQEMGGARSVTQCRIKWRDGLLPKQLRKLNTKRKARQSVPLRVVKRIQQLDIKSEDAINWETVSACDELKDLSVKDIRNAFANTKKSVLRRQADAKLSFKELLEAMHGQASKVNKLYEDRAGSAKSKEVIDSDDDEEVSDSEVDRAEVGL
ncbi:hypothetical protein CI109_103259 [Kwoniella shandongensis]|uniref:Uncharacterized protein n=1 Tax=Kwoniella shandongensis TaxID=1734106 RepID=A0A5M6BRU0_9TREE|nr:uncharacterized protein CI109_006069 [Kwoniella shandongensis]KAA5525618.1 hypothetical protein CI109_006069 [Kwoniella shandongensis]